MADVQPPARDQQIGALYARFSTLLQTVAVFFAVQYLISHFIGSRSVTPNTNDGVVVPKSVPKWEDRGVTPRENYNRIPQLIAPICSTGSSLDLTIYLSPSLAVPSHGDKAVRLLAHEEDFQLGNYSDQRQLSTILQVPVEIQQNGTWWTHFQVRLHDAPSSSYHFARPLNQILPKKRVAKKKNLLGGREGDLDEHDGPKYTFVSYYHPNLTLSFIPDSGTLSYPNLQPAVRQFVHLESSGARDPSGQNGWYYPMLFVNSFWQLRSQMMELNATVAEVPLHLTLNNLANWKMSIYASVDEGMKHTQRQAAHGATPAGGDGSEFEEFKRVLIDTNIYLLSTTAVVSILHMLFEALAFKSDISHWRNKKDNIGVSVRTILANVLMQTIIFLYLMDNSDGTSWMILFGQGMGILLEAWKITKTVDVRIRESPPGSMLPYHVKFEDKHKLSEVEEKTQEYDAIAFRYMYMIAVPLLAAYAAYSVIYEEHKGWYSFIITTLVGSVYAYGFLMMVPSLYINYRLKSVAHMPARAMTYKFLNTFIDDLFAFTIKMPTLHRLATLRDDVIFFFYLYQSYAYKVDYTRVNEFGQGGDEDESAKPTVKKDAVNLLSENKGAKQDGSSGTASDVGKSSARKRK